jgi:hypothetical protein
MKPNMFTNPCKKKKNQSRLLFFKFFPQPSPKPAIAKEKPKAAASNGQGKATSAPSIGFGVDATDTAQAEQPPAEPAKPVKVFKGQLKYYFSEFEQNNRDEFVAVFFVSLSFYSICLSRMLHIIHLA